MVVMYELLFVFLGFLVHLTFVVCLSSTFGILQMPSEEMNLT